MGSYEAVLILKGDNTAEKDKQVLAQIEAEIAKNSGKVEDTSKMAQRNIAYEINKVRQANFYQLNFNMEGDKVEKLTRSLNLNSDIIRSMISRKES